MKTLLAEGHALWRYALEARSAKWKLDYVVGSTGSEAPEAFLADGTHVPVCIAQRYGEVPDE